MEKRTRQWRRRQAARVFKARVKYHAAVTGLYTSNAGIQTYRPLWSDLAKEHWAQVYRTTGTPCSCWMCQGESYNRLEAKREMRRILKEEDV